MSQLDPEEERRRLAAIYADMAEGELEQLAENANELTEVARAALKDEFTRRQLEMPSPNSAGFDEPEYQPLVTVRQYTEVLEAMGAKCALESAGIETFLADANLVRMNWYISNYVGGVRLRVKPEDMESALAILNMPAPDPPSEEDGRENTPLCPQCGSASVHYERFSRGLALATGYFGVPLPIPRACWQCRQCGHSWRESLP